MLRTPLVLVACIGLWQTEALADDGNSAGERKEEAIEHSVVVGAGGAADLELRDGSLHPGANAFLEWEAIENWLALEIGASVLSADGGLEIPITLLVKKPFKLAPWADFLVGLGPQVVHVTGDTKGTYAGGAVALDFMFWPSRHVGLWISPEYDVVFRSGGSSAIGSTGGVLLGW